MVGEFFADRAEQIQREAQRLGDALIAIQKRIDVVAKDLAQVFSDARELKGKVTRLNAATQRKP